MGSAGMKQLRASPLLGEAELPLELCQDLCSRAGWNKAWLWECFPVCWELRVFVQGALESPAEGLALGRDLSADCTLQG